MTNRPPASSDQESASSAAEAAARVTIYDVADRAKVSIATVSHALNRPEKVSPKTRERVLLAVDELGFMPKATAVSLARKGVGRIAVVGPFSAYPSYFERLLGILHACNDRRVEVVVFDDDDQPDDRSPLLSSMPVSGRVDGIILMGVEPAASVAERLNKRRIPAVLLDRPSSVFSSVTVNDELGGRLLARHLIKQGVKRFAFASPPRPNAPQVTSGEFRMRGFRDEISEAGFDERLQWITVEDSIDDGRRIAAELLHEDSRPEAIFAVHDVLAAGIIRGLRETGLRVPEDVRVVGYDDSPLAMALDITTVRQPFIGSGRVAAEMLLSHLQAPDSPIAQISLSPELVVRRSG